MNTVYINTDTNMSAEVSEVYRDGARFKVTFRDMDCDAVIAIRYFPLLDDASEYAHSLCFPSGGTIASPTFLPTIR